MPVPTSTLDPVNAQILSVSEDRIQGFNADPFGAISELSGVAIDMVLQRVRAMLEAGTIRRVRQTLMATNLAPGALVAWQVPESKLDQAFDWMFGCDPFSGHVVIRTTNSAIAGARYRLWTTLKVPRPYSMERHCEFLMRQTGANAYRLMPAERLFALGVGHVRRRLLEPGSKSDDPTRVMDTTIADLSPLEWRVLEALKRELEPDEVRADLWQMRADEAELPLEAVSVRGARTQPTPRHRGASRHFWNTPKLWIAARESPSSTRSSTGKYPSGERSRPAKKSGAFTS